MQLLSGRAVLAPGTVANTLQTVCSTPHVLRQALQRVQARQVRVRSTNLANKRCEPCEASHDAMDQMGLAMIMDQATAEKYRAEVRQQGTGMRRVGGRVYGRVEVRKHWTGGVRTQMHRASCTVDDLTH